MSRNIPALERMRNSMSSLETRKLNYLCQVFSNPGIGNAWRWYLQNRDCFQYPVHVPFLDMVVHNDGDLKYINNSVSIRDAFLFIFGCKEDEELLLGNGNPHKLNSSIVDRRMVGHGSLLLGIVGCGFSKRGTAIARHCPTR
jgi:hypothetical protein